MQQQELSPLKTPTQKRNYKRKMRRVARSAAGISRATEVQHRLVDNIQHVFNSFSSEIVDLTVDERAEMEQTIENGRIRLNNVTQTMFNNMVNRCMVEGIFGIKNRTYNDQFITCVYVKWAGFDHSQNTWEPLSELENNEAYHRFLENNREEVMDVNEGFMIEPSQ